MSNLPSVVGSDAQSGAFRELNVEKLSISQID